MTRTVDRLLGARTPLGRIVWVEDSAFHPSVIVEHQGTTTMMFASRILGQIQPRAERLPVEFSRLNGLHGAAEGYAITDNDHALTWLEPVLVGVA